MRFVIPLFGSDTWGRDGVATLPLYCSGTCASDWTQCDCPLSSTYRTCAALCPATARIRLPTNSASTRERIIITLLKPLGSLVFLGGTCLRPDHSQALREQS